MENGDRWDGSPGTDRKTGERVVIVRMWADGATAADVRARIIEVDPDLPHERAAACVGEPAIVEAVGVIVRRFVQEIGSKPG